MKRPSILFVRLAVAASLTFAIAFAAVVMLRSSRVLRSAAEDVRAEHEFRFVVRPLPSTLNNGFEPVSSPAVFVQAARFQDHLYVAGPAGLQEYDLAGTMLHQYSAGSDLPASPLIAIAPAVLSDSHEPELIVATADDGLLAFNGRTFRQILPATPEARAITAIEPVGSGHLLFGTKTRGVLIYDGKQITVLHPTLDALYVTALAGNESDLWIGTLNRGILHFHAGQTDAFSESEGLPDHQVESLAISGDATYVGTATGVAVFSAGRFSRVLAPGVLATALLASPTQLYVGSEDQGVTVIPLEGRRPNPNLGPGAQLPEVHQLFMSDNAVFAVARNGLYRMAPHAFGWQRVLENSAVPLHHLSPVGQVHGDHALAVAR